jgi:hypothetical protein
MRQSGGLLLIFKKNPKLPSYRSQSSAAHRLVCKGVPGTVASRTCYVRSTDIRLKLVRTRFSVLRSCVISTSACSMLNALRLNGVLHPQ